MLRRHALLMGLAAAAISAPAAANPASPPLLSVEARAGYGATMGGGAGDSSVRTSPITFTALVDWAVRSDPWVSGYAGLVGEVGDRGAAGLLAGVRARPEGGSPLRVSAGGVYIAAPYDLFGPAVGLGGCARAGSTGLCLDLEGTFFVAGDDLPDQRVATQIQLVLGVSFGVH